jgi:hypothetical protein
MRYFFNVYNGFARKDEIGSELPDVAAAQAEAIRLASDLLAPEAAMIWKGEDWYIEVTTGATGEVVFTIKFSAKLKPTTA